jgi:alpha-glucosidase
MADFDRLVDAVHGRGMRLIMDLVANHTSNRHPWFVESRSSRANSKRDWYIWRDGRPDGRPPNNWVSYFGSAWTFDEPTGQFYFHQFREEQPELNYQNPDVLEAILGVMRFWLERGVDGFRADVISHLAKDARFEDEPTSTAYKTGDMAYFSLTHVYTVDQPAVHDYVRAMRRLLDSFGDRVLLGELDPTDQLMAYYGVAGDECHLPFNFHLILQPWDPAVVRRVVDAYEAALPPGAWPNWVLGNHDRHRVATRVGREQARVAQVLLLTLRGTPICYYGDELGMENVNMPVEHMRDMNGLGADWIARYSRDPQRTPMQWSAGPNAGFCPPGGEPWLPVGGDFETVNVEAEMRDSRSVLALFRRLIALRRARAALSIGGYRSLDAGHPAVFAYERSHDGDRIVVVLNFGDACAPLRLGSPGDTWQVLLSTELDRQGLEKREGLALRPNEGLVLEARGGRGG